MHTKLIQLAIADVVEEFQGEPLDFLYESDIQGLLFSELRRQFRDHRQSYDVQGVQKFFKKIPVINPVKTEYPLDVSGSRARFDIGVLAGAANPGLKIWRQPCRAAIEIKLWQPDGTGNDPAQDVQKLQEYLGKANALGRQFTGITLLFVHPVAESRLESLHGKVADRSIPENGNAFQIVTGEQWYGFDLS